MKIQILSSLVFSCVAGLALAGGDSHDFPVPAQCNNTIDGNRDCPGSASSRGGGDNATISPHLPETVSCPEDLQFEATFSTVKVVGMGVVVNGRSPAFGPSSCNYRVVLQTSGGLAQAAGLATLEEEELYLDFVLNGKNYRLRLALPTGRFDGNLIELGNFDSPYDIISNVDLLGDQSSFVISSLMDDVLNLSK